MAVHVFDRDTAVRRAGDGKFEAEIEGHRWWVVRGPNGGFVAAILLRAITEELGDPGRPPRSLSVHYPGAPQPGTLEISVTRERVGRTGARSGRLLGPVPGRGLPGRAPAGRPAAGGDRAERPSGRAAVHAELRVPLRARRAAFPRAGGSLHRRLAAAAGTSPVRRAARRRLRGRLATGGVLAPVDLRGGPDDRPHRPLPRAAAVRRLRLRHLRLEARARRVMGGERRAVESRR
ncbi:MAG: thioesterase family protein, partial [Actinobacteria bacterium]